MITCVSESYGMTNSVNPESDRSIGSGLVWVNPFYAELSGLFRVINMVVVLHTDEPISRISLT